MAAPDELVDRLQRISDDVYMHRRFEALSQWLAPDFTLDFDIAPPAPTDRERMIAVSRHLCAAFPDLRFEPRLAARDGDTVILQEVMSGTHRGEFRGLPPTGRRFETRIVRMARFREDEIVNLTVVVDPMAILRQIAALPEVQSFPSVLGRLLAWRARRKG